MLADRGDSYLEAVTFPEMRTGNARLAAVNPDAVTPGELASHLEETLRWYERGWTLHWTRPRTTPSSRFAQLLKKVTGADPRDMTRDLLALDPNKMTEAVDGLVTLARIGQTHPQLRESLESRSPEEVATCLESLDAVEGGPAFLAELRSFLEPERQGLRAGSSWGVEQNQCLPGWRETPSVVIALIQRYLPLDLDSLEHHHAQQLAQRNERSAGRARHRPGRSAAARVRHIARRRPENDPGQRKPQLLHRLRHQRPAPSRDQRSGPPSPHCRLPRHTRGCLVPARAPGAPRPPRARYTISTKRH